MDTHHGTMSKSDSSSHIIDNKRKRRKSKRLRDQRKRLGKSEKRERYDMYQNHCDDDEEHNDDDYNEYNDNLVDIITYKDDEISSTDKCPNPLCDHAPPSKGHNKRRKKNKPIEVNTIDDLIELGKTFHCQRNTHYKSLDLRVVCKLVPPLIKLRNMIGMHQVKQNIINQIIFYLQKLNKKDSCNECANCLYGTECSKNVSDDMLHTIITGSPGVGKSELGKILGEIYCAMEVLKDGKFYSAKRSDLVGKYLGHTASKTQKFINKCKGGVMFIDEAYALGHEKQQDSFSKECIDTLNQNLSEKRDFICIIAGYEDALETCFFQCNEGLRRRFAFKYNINEYTPEELKDIFIIKVNNGGWKIDPSLKQETLNEFFKKNKHHFPYFGGDIETLVVNCKIVHGKRVLLLDDKYKKVMTKDDLDRGLEMYKTYKTNKKTNMKSRIANNQISYVYSGSNALVS